MRAGVFVRLRVCAVHGAVVSLCMQETASERFLQDSRGAPYNVDKSYHGIYGTYTQTKFGRPHHVATCVAVCALLFCAACVAVSSAWTQTLVDPPHSAAHLATHIATHTAIHIAIHTACCFLCNTHCNTHYYTHCNTDCNYHACPFLCMCSESTTLSIHWSHCNSNQMVIKLGDYCMSFLLLSHQAIIAIKNKQFSRKNRRLIWIEMEAHMQICTALSHTLQHALQHTLQHTLQYILQYIPQRTLHDALQCTLQYTLLQHTLDRRT